MSTAFLRLSDEPATDADGKPTSGVELHASFMGGIDPTSKAHRVARSLIGIVDRHMAKLGQAREHLTGNVIGEDARIEMDLMEDAEAVKAKRERLHIIMAGFGGYCHDAPEEIHQAIAVLEEQIVELAGWTEPVTGGKHGASTGADVSGDGGTGGDETARRHDTDDGSDRAVRDAGRPDPASDRGGGLDGLAPDGQGGLAGTC